MTVRGQFDSFYTVFSHFLIMTCSSIKIIMDEVEELTQTTIKNCRLEWPSDSRSEIGEKSYEFIVFLNEAYFFKFWDG